MNSESSKLYNDDVIYDLIPGTAALIREASCDDDFRDKTFNGHTPHESNPLVSRHRRRGETPNHRTNNVSPYDLTDCERTRRQRQRFFSLERIIHIQK